VGLGTQPITTVPICSYDPIVTTGQLPLNMQGMEFGGSGAFSVPTTPPQGTYTITDGTHTLTFNNVESINLDSTMKNVYIPSIELTMSSGQVTNVQWQWWKKDSNGNWVNPSDQEIQTVMGLAMFEIDDITGSNGRVTGSMALTSSGSVVPTAQSFTPKLIRLMYADRAGYVYEFGDWTH
jgi:hypothetical protein